MTSCIMNNYVFYFILFYILPQNLLTWKTSLEAQSIRRCAGYSVPLTTRQISFIRRSAYNVAIFKRTVRELST